LLREDSVSYTFLKIEKTGDFQEIVLNHPVKRNALSLEMISELLAALATKESKNALGIIISAAGPVFSSGHDFSDMIGQDLDTMRDLMHACAHLMQTLQSLPQPVLAKVQGPAIAAGCQLALSCDLVVASENALFRTPGGSAGWFCFTPMVALTTTPTQAAAILLPILCVMDIVGVIAYRKTWDPVNMRILVPGALIGILLGTATFRFLDESLIRLLIGALAVGFVLQHWLEREPSSEPAGSSVPAFSLANLARPGVRGGAT